MRQKIHYWDSVSMCTINNNLPILLKLHSDVKYLGKSLLEAGPKKSVAEDTNDDILFLEESSVANK